MVATKEETFRKEEDLTSLLVGTGETEAGELTTTITTVLQLKVSLEEVADLKSTSAAKVTHTMKSQAKSKSSQATGSPRHRISTSLRMKRMMKLFNLSSKTNHSFRNQTILYVCQTTLLKITKIFASRFVDCPTLLTNVKLGTSSLILELQNATLLLTKPMASQLGTHLFSLIRKRRLSVLKTHWTENM